jgi:hypothetical protein
MNKQLDKLCVNCKHAWKHTSGGLRCQRPELGVNTVDGKPIIRWCDIERRPPWLIAAVEGSCGKRGRFFVLK